MAVHRALGLTDDEAEQIERILGRAPNHLELAMYAVMWSEHCSYKSSRIHLKRLPTEAPWVLVGPGENAGVVDVGDGIAPGICNASRNVVGLMPHPERASAAILGSTDGAPLLQSLLTCAGVSPARRPIAAVGA